MNALVPTTHDGVEQAHKLLAPAIHGMGTGGDQPLRSTKLPPWQELVRIGQGVKANLAKRTDAGQAADLIDVLIGARVNAKMADPDKYLRAVRSLLTNSPPDVAAEAVHVLIKSNKYMPEIAEIETALQDATFKRNQIVSACRAGYREQQRRHADREARDQRESERSSNKADPCWQAWFAEFQAGRHVSFEEFQRTWNAQPAQAAE